MSNRILTEKKGQKVFYFTYENEPSIQITYSTLKRVLFQLFHHLRTHPQFIENTINFEETTKNHVNEKNYIIIDSNSII